MNGKKLLLAINPGSTSTKIAVYEDESNVFAETIIHSLEELAPFAKVKDQYGFRLHLIEQALQKHGVETKNLTAVVGRGGPIKPLQSGTYLVDEAMCEDLRLGNVEHASNLGGLLAKGIADAVGVAAYIVDPVSVDEMEDVARMTGWPEVSRRSLFHALNLRAVAHRAAAHLGKKYEELNAILVHLGGGISVASLTGGRMIDVTNPNDAGPFSPERAGALPTEALARICFSGAYDFSAIQKKLVGKAGVVAHLGINDGREIEKRIAAGDEKASNVYKAMTYNIAKEIGAMSTVLCGKVDAVILTGGMAHSQLIIQDIACRVKFIAQVLVYPGEDELKALAEGTLRVLRGEEAVKRY